LLLAACGSRYELGQVRRELDRANPMGADLIAHVIIDEASDGEAELSELGAVDAVGDVNGDGYADWLSQGSLEGERLGQRLMFGGPRAPGAAFTPGAGPLVSRPTNVAVRLQARPAGDVNGDGYADIVWSSLREVHGEPGDDSPWPEIHLPWSLLTQQRAYLAYGGDAGEGDELFLPDGAVSFEPLELAWQIFEAEQLAGADPDAEGHIAVQNIDLVSLGDIDVDGFDDLAYSYTFSWRGQRRTPTGGFEQTAVAERTEAATFVYYGGPARLTGSGLSARAAELPDVKALTSLGDIDGDGFPELAAQLDDGRASLLAGGPERLVGTVAALEVGTRLDAAEAVGARASAVERADVQSLGDLDGDGFADVTITQSEIGGGGMAYLFYGAEERATVPFLADYADAAFVVPSRDGRLGTLTPLGDWNGDGSPDLLSAFSAPRDTTDVGSGAKFRDTAVIIPGSAARYAGVYTPPMLDPTVTGTNAGAVEELIVLPIGDVDGDGHSDVQFSTPREKIMIKFGEAFSPAVIY
jgi:hypothetical protein